MKILNDEQGSEAWHRSRIGIITATRMGMITTSTGLWSKQAEGCIADIVDEMVHDAPAPEGYISDAMQHGNLYEPLARQTYAFDKDVTVQTAGLCLHDDWPIGFSPDGLIGDNGGLEIKCPKGKTHQNYCIEGKLPTNYKVQVMMALWISEREWWDFYSFQPFYAEQFCLRVYRDEKLISALRENALHAMELIAARYERFSKK